MNKELVERVKLSMHGVLQDIADRHDAYNDRTATILARAAIAEVESHYEAENKRLREALQDISIIAGERMDLGSDCCYIVECYRVSRTALTAKEQENE